MAMQWTKEQEQVISLRNRDILVSAAAGSGKTAVLVARILGLIMDKDNPVDIDKLLIMTFTRAAAGEMKERIIRALEDALYEDPDNEHLQRQMIYIHTAQITTIDGFCSYIIRNYFHLIDLDPGYRVGDEGELKLLKEDIIEQLLEDYYGKKEEGFTEFVECYATGKDDSNLAGIILKVYDAAMSHPHPEKWFEESKKAYELEEETSLADVSWLEAMWEDVLQDLEEALFLAEEADGICKEADGPALYLEAIASDMEMLNTLKEHLKRKNYDETASFLNTLKFARLSTKKQPDADDNKKEQVKKLRDEMKKLVGSLQTRYFPGSYEDVAYEMLLCASPVKMLIELAKEFKDRFEKAKREKNILDFTDMEHLTLKILLKEEGEVYHPSEAAKELSMKYAEVMVDEYQDSNYVQELITKCVSGWAKNQNNTFMVGDVKQSIYRFRLARPELFIEKYKTFTTEESPQQKIDLHKNFRSRHQVLESVNYLFEQIMGGDLGGIDYDKAAALYPGASYPEGESGGSPETEVLIIEKDGELLTEEEIKDAQELEALAIAHKIHQLKETKMIVDKKTGEYRKVEYNDIAVLLRTASGWAETFKDVFSAQGIPSYASSKTGYFSAVEVVTVLNYLKVCDNPLQDIPMAGVLRSPMVGCTTNELAILRSKYKEGMLYEILSKFVKDIEIEKELTEEETALKAKLKLFYDQLNILRKMCEYTPVHQIILEILDRTGYKNYASALPDGGQRRANLIMLVEKAKDYEKTSYKGLFNFVRYIEKLQKYEVDYGEVNLSDSGSGAVQIMTIHKSKGLEFPIVFAAGMGKQFNFMDLNERLLIHPDMGIGTDLIRPKERIISSTLMKQLIRRRILKETLGEELRVLYVALTRAKEKLYITGTLGKIEEVLYSISRYREKNEKLLPFGMRIKGKSYWSYILPGLARHECMTHLFEEYGIIGNSSNNENLWPAKIHVEKITAEQLVTDELHQQIETELKKSELKDWDPEVVYDEKVRLEIKERFEFKYPHEYLKILPVKLSVSELKKRSWNWEADVEETVFKEEEPEAIVPAFIEAKPEEEYVGSLRGTAYHRIMECLDYSKADTKEDLRKQYQTLLESGKISKKALASISKRDIELFLKSPLGIRMKEAFLEKRLFREQPFVISRKASEIDSQWTPKESILIQGIIDAYFIDGDEIVLVDYKTDRVPEGNPEYLIQLYHTQLEDYAKAIESVTGKKVKEKIIYSFALKKEILL